MKDDTKPRIAQRFDISLTLHVELDGVERNGSSCNISIGGLCAIFENAFPTGHKVVVSLNLEYEEGQYAEFMTPARVVWCTKIGENYQCGMQFLPLEEDQRKLLEKFIATIKAKT